MKFTSIEPFIPSGKDYEGSKKLFQALGFTKNWENNGYAGFQRDDCAFILQHYEERQFAENLMIRVQVSDLDAFWKEVVSNKVADKFGIKVKEPMDFPYGREMHLIDLAGVCWHIGQSK